MRLPFSFHTFAAAAGEAAMSALPALVRPCSSASACSVSSRLSPAAAAVTSAIERLSRGSFRAAAARNLTSAKEHPAPPASTEINFARCRPLRSRLSSYPAPNKTRATRTITAMASNLKESSANNPGLDEKPDEATKGFFLQQTMYRIKDPKESLDFYTRILGMSLLKRLDFSEAKFSLYFLGYEDTGDAPTDESERVQWTFSKKATLELTHNWGTEADDNFKGHHNGNSDPRGYGHIGITVDDTTKACERFEKLGVKFVKKPLDGKMKGIAFIQDPDGYWIEIFDIKSIGKVTSS